MLRGEAGIGKTALLEYVAQRAGASRVARAAGVESEMELAFAGLQQLCAPMLDHADRLPCPQGEALLTAIGVEDGPAPDHFFVGLAVLNLLSDVADEKPLVCIVDDAHWLDHASARALAFVARRLLAERIALVFASRATDDADLHGLPELAVGGLRHVDACALLEAELIGPMDAAVRDGFVAETRGNPLALLELPRGLTPAELAGGFRLQDLPALHGRLEGSFRHRLDELPAPTRRLLLLAAADPLGEPGLLWRAARQLEIDAEAADPAVADGLIEIGTRVRFRHPLVRSAIYNAAPRRERRGAHRALAEATDADSDPDRHAWHRAHGVAAPDESVAGELERSAQRAVARGGTAAAAAFLTRAMELTPDPARRGARALAAARATIEAGAPETAHHLLATAELSPLDGFRARQARAAPRRTRVHAEPARRRPRSAARRGERARTARCRTRAGDIPSSVVGRTVRRPPGRRRGRARGGGSCARRARA